MAGNIKTNKRQIQAKKEGNVRLGAKSLSNFRLEDKTKKLCTQTSVKCHDDQIIHERVFNHSHSQPVHSHSNDWLADAKDEGRENKMSKNNRRNKSKENILISRSGKFPSGNKDISNHKPMDSANKTNSAPVIKKTNLEDSVDYIPVKLLRQQPQKGEAKSNSEGRLNKRQGPTWDQLLKGENNSLHQNGNQSKRDYCNNNNHGYTVHKNDTFKNSQKSIHSNPKNNDKLHDNNLNPILAAYNIEKNHKPEDATLHLSDPVKTLDNLIDQLRKKILMQPQNDNLNKIMLDMEKALSKISYENQSRIANGDGIANCDKVSAGTLDSVDTKQSNVSGSEMLLLKKNLEDSCHFLQSLCIKQRENCSNHLREKEQLSIQLAESRRLLAIANSKETDYEKTIGELRLKLQVIDSIKEQQSKTFQEMSENIAKLKSENEELCLVKSSLKQCSNEKDILQSKLYLKDLEIEKLKVLLQVTQNLNTASDKLNEKKLDETMIDGDPKLDIPINERGNIFSLSSEASLTLGKPRILCSSHMSSTPRHSPSPYDSWEHISSIPQELSEINDCRNSLVRVLNEMKDTEWNGSLDFDIEEPVVPSFLSEDEDDKKLNEIRIRCGSFLTPNK